MKRTFTSYIVILTILLTITGCSWLKKGSSPAKVQTHKITSGNYISGAAKIDFYQIVDLNTSQVVKLKKCNIKNTNTIYTIILAIRSTSPTVVTGFWDGTYRKYTSYRYKDGDLQGIEILFNRRDNFLLMDLSINPIYVTFDKNSTYKFVVPEKYWTQAHNTIVYGY